MNRESMDSKQITLFLTGDVMTGRGVDQILPSLSDPHLYEAYIKSAVGYVELTQEWICWKIFRRERSGRLRRGSTL